MILPFTSFIDLFLNTQEDILNNAENRQSMLFIKGKKHVSNNAFFPTLFKVYIFVFIRNEVNGEHVFIFEGSF